jgi:hypothetical protein
LSHGEIREEGKPFVSRQVPLEGPASPLMNSLVMRFGLTLILYVGVMGLLICAFIVLCLFFLRDVFVLGAKQEHAFLKLALYSLLMAVYLLSATRAVYALPDGRALVLLRSPWIWGATILVHAGLWRAAVWIKRRSNGRNAIWLLAIVPAPMLILSILVVGHHLSFGWIASAAWIVCVWAGVLAFRATYRGWEDWDCVSDVAQIASWTGIGILPFTGILEFTLH